MILHRCRRVWSNSFSSLPTLFLCFDPSRQFLEEPDLYFCYCKWKLGILHPFVQDISQILVPNLFPPFFDCGTSYLYIVACWWVQNCSSNLGEWKQEILMTISLWTGLRCRKCHSVTSGNVGDQSPYVKDMLCNLRHQYATLSSTFHVILKYEKKDTTKKKCVRVSFPEALAALLHLLFLNKSITYPTPHRAKELLL